ncbi:MAG TPA: hypothetical protein VMF65_22445 [Acidimicrobiales bacterium]|nr:hypothetical protein [Acidimicrobiales bacterium]
MPTRREPTGDDARRERAREREHRGEHGRDGDEHEGDDPFRHASIIKQRWRGGAPPTPERLATALQQWQALPGAVVTPATYLRDEEATTNENGEG